MSETKTDIEAATVVVKSEKSETKPIAKWVCAGVAVLLVLLVATLVPYFYLKTNSRHSRAVALAVEVDFPGNHGSRTVSATVNLPVGEYKAQWHLMTTTDSKDDDRCVHLLHMDGKTYLFKSAACTFPLTSVTDCSVRDATEFQPAEMPTATMGVEALFNRVNTSTSVVSPASVVHDDAEDRFAAPALCVAVDEPTRPGLINDVRTVSELSVTRDEALVADAQKEHDPEGFIGLPCIVNPTKNPISGVGLLFWGGRVRWVGDSEYEYRTRFKTRMGNPYCEAERQSRSQMCSGFWGLWYPWSAWSGTHRYASCYEESTPAKPTYSKEWDGVHGYHE